MDKRKTVHIIFHAHLDPIWPWNWQAGVDEALATTRSACARLEAHPELRYSQGEAWVYRQVELLDPELFARVRAFVREGRWEIIGGWWTQPDCNFPDEAGMRLLPGGVRPVSGHRLQPRLVRAPCVPAGAAARVWAVALCVHASRAARDGAAGACLPLARP